MINYFFTSHFMIHRKAGYFLESSPEKCIKHAIYEIKITIPKNAGTPANCSK